MIEDKKIDESVAIDESPTKTIMTNRHNFPLGLFPALVTAVAISGCDNRPPVETTDSTLTLANDQNPAESAATDSSAQNPSQPADSEVVVMAPGPDFGGKNLMAGAWATLEQEPQIEPADNSYCYVCHANYEEEELTVMHQSEGVGCELCHGMSDEHSADEDGITPPEIMWAQDRINASCAECHAKDKLAEMDEHEEFFTETDPAMVCTDCHGLDHGLEVRTRVWDKKTGELLSDDGVRMMDADTPATSAK